MDMTVRESGEFWNKTRSGVERRERGSFAMEAWRMGNNVMASSQIKSNPTHPTRRPEHLRTCSARALDRCKWIFPSKFRIKDVRAVIPR